MRDSPPDQHRAHLTLCLRRLHWDSFTLSAVSLLHLGTLCQLRTVRLYTGMLTWVVDSELDDPAGMMEG